MSGKGKISSAILAPFTCMDLLYDNFNPGTIPETLCVHFKLRTTPEDTSFGFNFKHHLTYLNEAGPGLGPDSITTMTACHLLITYYMPGLHQTLHRTA